MPKKKVDNGYSRQLKKPRHKCSGCGCVRFEKFMEKYTSFDGSPLSTRYGNQMWVCSDNKECEKEAFNY